MKTITARDLARGVIELVSLPEIFIQVNAMVDNPKYSAKDIGTVIEDDPGVSARLLKLVNSPFYGFPSRIDTISRAVTIIGTRELRDIVLATSVIRTFKGLPNDLVTMDDFWRHSILCGIAARLLATYKGLHQAEHFFVAGLLHDLGSLIIYKKLPEPAREVLLRTRHSNEVLYQVEQELLGFDHAEVGLELVRAWKLPSTLIESVGYHHAPENAQDHPLEASVAHVADLIVTALELGRNGPIPPLSAEAAMQIDLSPEMVDTVASGALQQIQAVYNSLFSAPSPRPVQR